MYSSYQIKNQFNQSIYISEKLHIYIEYYKKAYFEVDIQRNIKILP